MAQQSFQAPSANPFNPMTLASLALSGEPNDPSDYKKGRPITKLLENNGRIRLSTFLNIPDVKVPPLGVEISYHSMLVLLDEMLKISDLAEAKSPYPDGKYSIVVDSWFGKGQTRLEKPEKSCVVTVGIDGEGLCYLSIQHKNSKNIVHRFGPPYLEKIINGAGEPIEQIILSARYFRSWAEKMKVLIPVNTIVNGKEPVKRNQSSGSSDNNSDVANSWSEFK